MSCQEGDFEVGAVLLFSDSAFFQGLVQVVDDLVAAFGAIGLILDFGSRADCFDEQVAEFLHDCEGGFALGEEIGVAVEIGEVEEEGLEESLFDDCLELLEALAWFL